MPRGVRCPKCGSETVLRTVKEGPNAGLKFYVCTRYPKCKGRVRIVQPPVKWTDVAGQEALTTIPEETQGLDAEEPIEGEEEEIIIGLMRFAAGKVAEGKNRSQVLNELIREGVPYGVASAIVDGVFEYRSAVIRKGGAKSIGCGLLMLIVAGIITAVTYAATEPGGYYFVMIGLFIAGVIALLRGLYYLLRG